MAHSVMFLLVLSLFIFIKVVYAPIPPYTNIFSRRGHERTGFIAAYFRQGYSYKDIVLLLATLHGITLTVNGLRGILRRMGLRRNERLDEERLRGVIEAVRSEMEGSGECLGYRAMWKRLNRKGTRVPRDAVRIALKVLRPHLVEERRRHRLHRRSYANPGPNFCWHVDGYDKLKPFGFAIHGCIDGYSRKIMWLHVGKSNNNPEIIGLYFVQALLKHEAVPCILRTDRGTENVHLEKIQKFLRRDGTDMLAAENSFVYGRSTSNQRIEAWWAVLRRQCITFWINMFKDMTTLGLINMQDPLHVHCLRFCFMEVIAQEIDRVAKDWNVHHIQSRRGSGNVAGKPDKMYYVPEEFDTASFSAEFKENEIKEIEQELELTVESNTLHDPDFVRIVNIVCPDWEYPTNAETAQDLYVQILGRIAEFENALP